MKSSVITLVLILSSIVAQAQDIFSAARNNDTILLKVLLAHTPVDTIGNSGFTQLTIAVYNNSIEATQLLISKGADINAKDTRSGNTALMGAIFKGYTDMSKYLLEKGAHPDVLNYNGATALIFATTFGQYEVAKMLIEMGADKSIKDNRGHTALDYANNQDNAEMIALLSQ